MKTPKDIGRDFDKYAKEWERKSYKMEVGYSGEGAKVSDSSHVKVPGDEWGEQRELEKLYRPLFETFVHGQANILEVGAGAGRLTEVIVKEFADCVASYHTVDVSKEMTRHLKERLKDFPQIQAHLIKGCDLSVLPDDHFDLVIVQSCWSHVNLYDQFLYLRNLRRTIRTDGLLLVNGIFMLGLGEDWGWNRFLRRIYQREHDMRGVYHEFTGTRMVVEMMLRLGWVVEALSTHAFIARFPHRNKVVAFKSWSDVPEERRRVPVYRALLDFLEEREPINEFVL